MNTPFNRFFKPVDGLYQVDDCSELVYHYAILVWRLKGCEEVEVLLSRKEALRNYLRRCSLSRKIAIGNRYYAEWRRQDERQRSQASYGRVFTICQEVKV